LPAEPFLFKIFLEIFKKKLTSAKLIGKLVIVAEAMIVKNFLK